MSNQKLILDSEIDVSYVITARNSITRVHSIEEALPELVEALAPAYLSVEVNRVRPTGIHELLLMDSLDRPDLESEVDKERRLEDLEEIRNLKILVSTVKKFLEDRHLKNEFKEYANVLLYQSNPEFEVEDYL